MRVTRALTSQDLAYRDGGLQVLYKMLGRDEGIEAPELQAVYNWCLDQNWDATPEQLEEFGPVVGMGIVFGDIIAARTKMVWVWLDDSDFNWSGPALQLAERELFCSPLTMLAKRLADRCPVHLESLIRDTVTNIFDLRGPMEQPKH